MRIGIGYDIHRLTKGRKLFLGGINIPYGKGLVGHSDADVLLHAISDALLGAVSEGDIGDHFPDTDTAYNNIASSKLLKKVRALIKKKGYMINNIDTVIIAQEPKLTPFKKRMRQNIARMLDIKEEIVSIKAKTNDGVGEIGKKDAIASYAIVLVNKKGG
ncbi:MAG: 2-C-methyl-D-erythritol 2,4-cyclodiphosphate synthase [Candidatus Omnitrophica bacterium]|nr:2-C-methyl-D-erythritol 2,4-cyclodiphosphate synthase [Candidatus Omnitrophota bacterium]